MKAGIAAAVGALGLAMSSFANADWTTIIQDDIFNGGKTAVLVGPISQQQSVAFDCDSDGLSLALLQKDKWSETRVSSTWNLLIKIDAGEIYRFTAASRKRNDQYVQYITQDKDEILKVLAELRGAKSKILLGIQSAEFDSKWSGTASVGGSTKATNEFIQACKLKVD